MKQRGNYILNSKSKWEMLVYPGSTRTDEQGWRLRFVGDSCQPSRLSVGPGWSSIQAAIVDQIFCSFFVGAETIGIVLSSHNLALSYWLLISYLNHFGHTYLLLPYLIFVVCFGFTSQLDGNLETANSGLGEVPLFYLDVLDVIQIFTLLVLSYSILLFLSSLTLVCLNCLNLS